MCGVSDGGRWKECSVAVQRAGRTLSTDSIAQSRGHCRRRPSSTAFTSGQHCTETVQLLAHHSPPPASFKITVETRRITCHHIQHTTQHLSALSTALTPFSLQTHNTIVTYGPSRLFLSHHPLLYYHPCRHAHHILPLPLHLSLHLTRRSRLRSSPRHCRTSQAIRS